MNAPPTNSLLERLRRSTLGRYDVYAELGHGGMATVFLAIDLALDRKVAIKVLDPSLAISEEHMERFRREARVAASLNHPNIIGIHAVGDDPELAYFVMKYVEGRGLDSVLKESGAQSVAFVKGVIASAGKALHYAHQRGVVHRDVKPANFLLDKEGWLIVTDFGIAKRDDAQGLTMTGSIIGTPFYMAPEQFQGIPITAAADQYALGVVAFELLTGKQPFSGATIGEVMKGHLFDPVPDLRSLRPDLPEQMQHAITRMLAKDPERRFASLEEAVAAFGQVTATQEQELRTQIIQLAEFGARLQPQIAVPASPVPQKRNAAASANGNASPPEQGSAPVSHRRRNLLLVALGLIVGVGGATAMLRPDIVNRYRKQLIGRTGDAADTGTIIRSQSRSGESEDFLGGIPPEEQDAIGRRNTGDTAVRATPGPQPIPGSLVYATVYIGSDCANASLSLNGSPLRGLGPTPAQIPVLAGDVRLTLHVGELQRWDTLMTVEAGREYRIGVRPGECRGEDRGAKG